MRNLKRSVDYFLGKKKESYDSERALAEALGVAPNTVGNWFPMDGTEPSAKARIDKLAIVASKLNCEVWHLLHPDIGRYFEERRLLKKSKELWARGDE